MEIVLHEGRLQCPGKFDLFKVSVFNPKYDCKLDVFRGWTNDELEKEKQDSLNYFMKK